MKTIALKTVRQVSILGICLFYFIPLAPNSHATRACDGVGRWSPLIRGTLEKYRGIQLSGFADLCSESRNTRKRPLQWIVLLSYGLFLAKNPYVAIFFAYSAIPNTKGDKSFTHPLIYVKLQLSEI